MPGSCQNCKARRQTTDAWKYQCQKDWGYAPDYVKLFPELLKLPKGDDFVFASGKLHSVKDMVEVAFASLNYKISWKGRDENTIAINSSGETVVAIDTRFYRPMDNRYLIGNKEKLAKTFNINLFTPYEKWVKTWFYLNIRNFNIVPVFWLYCISKRFLLP